MYLPEPCECCTWRSDRSACLWTVHQSGPPWSIRSVRSSHGCIQPPVTQWCQQCLMQDFQVFRTFNIWPKDLHIFIKAVLIYLIVQKFLMKFYQGWIKCQHSFWNSINLQRFHHSCQIEGCRIYRWEVWCIHRSHCSSPFLAVSHPTHRPVWFVSLPCQVPWKLNQQLLLYMHKTFA